MHSIPLEIDENAENPQTFDEVFRSQDCHVLTLLTLCESCDRMEKLHASSANKVKKNIEVPAKSKAPLSYAHQNKIALA